MRHKLIAIREQNKLTQDEVAKKLGISRSFYGLIETGLRNPSYGLAKKIAGVFGVEAEDIFLDLEGFRTKPIDSATDDQAATLDTDNDPHCPGQAVNE